MTLPAVNASPMSGRKFAVSGFDHPDGYPEAELRQLAVENEMPRTTLRVVKAKFGRTRPAEGVPPAPALARALDQLLNLKSELALPLNGTPRQEEAGTGCWWVAWAAGGNDTLAVNQTQAGNQTPNLMVFMPESKALSTATNVANRQGQYVVVRAAADGTLGSAHPQQLGVEVHSFVAPPRGGASRHTVTGYRVAGPGLAPATPDLPNCVETEGVGSAEAASSTRPGNGRRSLPAQALASGELGGNRGRTPQLKARRQEMA